MAKVRHPGILATALLLTASCAAPGPRPGLLPAPAAGTQEPAAQASTAPQDPEPEPRGYLAARLQDLLDALPFSIGIGPGLYAGARFTVVGPGLGATGEVQRHGWATNPTRWSRAGHWREHGELGLLFTSSRSSDPSGHSIAYTPIGPFHTDQTKAGLEWPMVLDLEGSVHVGIVGVRAGLSPIQLADFLLGWFGVDLVGDDHLGSWTRVHAWPARPYFVRPDQPIPAHGPDS